MGGGLSRNNVSNVYRFGPNDLIGRGRGSMVYKATLLQHDRVARDGITLIPNVVAIKVIDKTLLSSFEIDRLADERNILHKFQHTYSIKLYEHFETWRSLCLVTEYIEGGNLFRSLSKRNKFSEQEAASIIKQLASVVAALASKNIVHRDIRPENILLENTSSTRIRLINYGLAAKIKKGNLTKGLSTVCGTTNFVAPEVLGRCYGTQADVWAIGVLLYLLLSGNFPFQSQKSMGHHETYSLIKGGTFSLNGRGWEEISEDAKSLISRLLVVDPQDRMLPSDILQDPWILQFAEINNSCKLLYSKYESLVEETPEDTADDTPRVSSTFGVIEN